MKNTTKVCPICIAGANNYVGRCIGEDCAWFLEYADDCAVPFGTAFSYVEDKRIRSGVTTFITYLAVYFACKYVFGI